MSNEEGIKERLEEQEKQALNEQQIDEWIDQLKSIKNELENPVVNLSKVNEKKKLEKRIKQLQKHLEDADVSAERYIETIQNLNTKIKEIGNETDILRTQIRESKIAMRDLENTKTSLQKQIAELKEKNESLKKQLNKSRPVESTATTGDSTIVESISRKNRIANTIRKRKEENKQALIRIQRIMRETEEEIKIEQERIAKLQQERDRRKIERERQQIKDADREAVKKAEQHTYENITGKPDYLERIKEIELSINSQSVEDNYRSLADELDELGELYD